MLQTFLPLFIMTFGICLFIVLMQFLWRYIDDMVGKGLGIPVLGEMFFYAALFLLPMALPLAILLASLMTFGNLGERLELLAMKSAGVSLIHQITEGGILVALWELSQKTGMGIEADMKRISVLQETIEICNFFDVNPYQMHSKGCALLLSENGCRLKERLFERGICSEVIGFTTEDNDRVVINGAEQRYLQKCYTEALEGIF